MPPAPAGLDRRSLLIGLPLLCAGGPSRAAPASAFDLTLPFVDEHGASRTLAEWRGRTVVMAMAYGACRSVCSSTLRTLEELQAAADRRGVAIEVVVASIDPAEDTPQAWADYRKSHRLTHVRWTFLCGSAQATRALARFLGVRFWTYDEHVMHDFKVVRLDAGGAIAATLDWQHREVDRLL